MFNNKLRDINNAGKVIDQQMGELIRNNKLPEHLFVNTFLPFFSGELSLNEKPDLLLTWYSIAGSQFNEVDIINPKGEIIFTVPAIADRTIINPLKTTNSNVTLSDIVALSKQYETSLPIVAENKLVQNLLAKEKELREKSTDYNNNEIRWINILSRYGKIKTNINSDKQGSQSSLTEDDMMF